MSELEVFLELDELFFDDFFVAFTKAKMSALLKDDVLHVLMGLKRSDIPFGKEFIFSAMEDNAWSDSYFFEEGSFLPHCFI